MRVSLVSRRDVKTPGPVDPSCLVDLCLFKRAATKAGEGGGKQGDKGRKQQGQKGQQQGLPLARSCESRRGRNGCANVVCTAGQIAAHACANGRRADDMG